MSRKTAAQKASAAAVKNAVTTNTDGPAVAEQDKARCLKHDDREKPPPSKKPRLDQEEEVRAKESTSKPAQKVAFPSASAAAATTATSNKRRPGIPRPAIPPPPRSVRRETQILPREADDPKLRANHDIHTVNVATSSKIEGKVTSVLLAFRDAAKQDGGRGKRKTIVALSANAKAANKCVSIAEIAKREYVKGAGEGGLARKVWQYTGCWTRLETYEPVRAAGKTKAARNEIERREEEDVDEADGGEELSEDAFEDVKEVDRPKVRNATCMVIFLSIEPVARLKELYGEQIYDRDKI